MFLNSPAAPGFIPKRIISLVPSQTELLHYLGLEAETIGLTKFCIHPAIWFQTKARIGGTKTLDIEKIKGLKPDLIIANLEENVKEQVEALAAIFNVWVTDVTNLETSIKMINDIGQLTGKEKEASNLVLKINIEFAFLEEEVLLLTNDPVRAVYLIWKDPYMTIGGDSFIHDMMQRCGFKNMFADFERYPEVTINQLKEMNCEAILLSSEPFPFAEKHIAALQAALPGVKILLVDGEMFSWYGSRLLQAPAYFKELALRFLG